MLLTYKLKHNRDFSEELSKAKKIADFAIKNRKNLSTKYIKHIGLKSVIANQILRKYGRNRKCKKITSVKLIIPNQGIKYTEDTIRISSLKLNLQNTIKRKFEKINQIEMDNTYAYITVTVEELPKRQYANYIGVDRNTTGHVVVAANLNTGKVYKLGRKAQHVHKKYSNIRKRLQKSKKYRQLKKVKRRESRIIKDLNHKISNKLIKVAEKEKACIVLENLKGIRKTRKNRKSFRYSLNSWSYYQLGMFVDYKSKLHGIQVFYVDPQYTSQNCSICGRKGNRKGKKFECGYCNHVDHADVNASFNIAKRQCMIDFQQKEMLKKRSLITLESSGLEGNPTLEPPRL